MRGAVVPLTACNKLSVEAARIFLSAVNRVSKFSTWTEMETFFCYPPFTVLITFYCISINHQALQQGLTHAEKHQIQELSGLFVYLAFLYFVWLFKNSVRADVSERRAPQLAQSSSKWQRKGLSLRGWIWFSADMKMQNIVPQCQLCEVSVYQTE